MTTGGGAPGSGRRAPRAAVAAAVVVAALVITGLALTVPSRLRPPGNPVGPDRAVAIARQFFDGAHGSGARVVDVVVESVVSDHDAAGRDVWRVTIHGSVIEAGQTTPSYASVMRLLVDVETGVATIDGEG